MFFGFERKIKQAVDEAVRGVYGRALNEGADAVRLSIDIVNLKKQISDLEIQQAKKQEDWDRREREIEHKVGLERKRQEFEVDAASRKATLDIQEKNLAADKDRFKAEMDFQRSRLEGEVGSLRELVGEMLKRLPSAEVFMDVSKKR